MATMKVKPWGKGQGDHVVIEVENYDPKFHKKFPVKKVTKKKAGKK